jgi:proteasome accessory factor B
MRPADAELLRGLERKVHYVQSGGRRFYEERIDDVNEALTGLLKNQRLSITYPGRDGDRTFLFEPYTLVFYRTGIYLAGRREGDLGVVKLSLDRCVSIEWRRDDSFTCPAGYSPNDLADGAFGLIRGDEVSVRVRFDAAVAWRVERAQWHPTQVITREDDGRIVLSMRVAGATELFSWILSWGAHAEVLEPEELRAEIAGELRKSLGQYA